MTHRRVASANLAPESQPKPVILVLVGCLMVVWAAGFGEVLWRPAVGLAGSVLAASAFIRVIRRPGRRWSVKRSQITTVLLYLVMPTISTVTGSLIVALIIGAWKP